MSTPFERASSLEYLRFPVQSLVDATQPSQRDVFSRHGQLERLAFLVLLHSFNRMANVAQTPSSRDYVRPHNARDPTRAAVPAAATPAMFAKPVRVLSERIMSRGFEPTVVRLMENVRARGCCVACV
jgi:hypothetical protein